MAHFKQDEYCISRRLCSAGWGKVYLEHGEGQEKSAASTPFPNKLLIHTCACHQLWVQIRPEAQGLPILMGAFISEWSVTQRSRAARACRDISWSSVSASSWNEQPRSTWENQWLLSRNSDRKEQQRKVNLVLYSPLACHLEPSLTSTGRLATPSVGNRSFGAKRTTVNPVSITYKLNDHGHIISTLSFRSTSLKWNHAST